MDVNNKSRFSTKSLFIIALVTALVTTLVVYLSGIPFSRSLTSNTLISLSVLAVLMFFFLVYALYKGLPPR